VFCPQAARKEEKYSREEKIFIGGGDQVLG
jgi:hypothetical protein